MELPPFLRVWQLVAIVCQSVHNHTWSRPNGNLQFTSGQRLRDSLRSAMASIVDCFVYNMMFDSKRRDSFTPLLLVLGKFCFQLRK